MNIIRDVLPKKAQLLYMMVREYDDCGGVEAKSESIPSEKKRKLEEGKKSIWAEDLGRFVKLEYQSLTDLSCDLKLWLNMRGSRYATRQFLEAEGVVPVRRDASWLRCASIATPVSRRDDQVLCSKGGTL
ncbi:hypothetical protein NEOLI_004163 [Neolecta irregularis DAH-3]|uniref:Uncharacterized protein n=1 Tax=Neolecta irregularis (strain DAH-3) TaxID=1198029 RepID=A0A1U7LP16_NEOID|nr:hypothetical protein NEOLI_004163 [Neolecta irregularis DAH-3]|eukprot:OLL24379.1 hypothetical protein NEOLI_004163 [Neolecta irregularis DAH-3]